MLRAEESVRVARKDSQREDVLSVVPVARRRPAAALAKLRVAVRVRPRLRRGEQAAGRVNVRTRGAGTCVCVCVQSARTSSEKPRESLRRTHSRSTVGNMDHQATSYGADASTASPGTRVLSQTVPITDSICPSVVLAPSSSSSLESKLAMSLLSAVLVERDAFPLALEGVLAVSEDVGASSVDASAVATAASTESSVEVRALPKPVALRSSSAGSQGECWAEARLRRWCRLRLSGACGVFGWHWRLAWRCETLQKVRDSLAA